MTLAATIVKRISASFTIDVDLRASAGITILFGASGSGKSTILRCIAGLMTPDEGRITLDDAVLYDGGARVNAPPQHRHVGMVFQQLALFPHLTVAGNICYGLSDLPQAERNSRLAETTRMFRIEGLLDRKPARLSGGERQRVALARTLVTEPSLLLLDEPLTALDFDIQSRIIDDLRRWNEQRRIPVLYVTHTHREVYALGEQVIVIDNGRVLATGVPHAVLEHPTHPLVANLAGFENLLEGHVLERDEIGGTMQVRIGSSGPDLEVPIADLPSGSAVTVGIRAGDILIANEPPHGLSALNIIEASLAASRREGPAMVADVRTTTGTRLVVHVTPRAFERLGLHAGGRVWLAVKSYSCRIARNDTIRGGFR
jgi:molybdate transport system ATP-binding protein